MLAMLWKCHETNKKMLMQKIIWIYFSIINYKRFFANMDCKLIKDFSHTWFFILENKIEKKKMKTWFVESKGEKKFLYGLQINFQKIENIINSKFANRLFALKTIYFQQMSANIFAKEINIVEKCDFLWSSCWVN